MKDEQYFNRDLSWLSFNERVLQEAADMSVPLYERIKFLAIYSSNLDEFFRVRMALIKRLALVDKEKLSSKADLKSPKKLLERIARVIDVQQDYFGRIFQGDILPELRKNNIHLYYREKYKDEHIQAVEDLFYSEILSFIQPQIIQTDSDKNVFLENRRLYTVANLEKDGASYLGIVNIPSNHVSRFQELPDIKEVKYYTFIDDIIKQFLNIVFPGFEIKNSTSVKLNRDAELFLADEFEADVAKKISKSLSKRNIGNPSRFLYNPKMKPQSLELLKQHIDLDEEDCFPGGEYHNMDDLFGFPNPIGSELENPPQPSLAHASFDKMTSIFSALEEKDVLLSFPYQKYDYILRFFNEAAIDPYVTRIKATLYRVAKDSHITNALIGAALNGKEVTILVEAKARFDEENNLSWAQKMSEAGVKVKYSTLEIKVHSKVALIHRKLPSGEETSYSFLGTGNFNEKTAGIYTDYALLTCNPVLNEELDKTLEFIFGNKKEIDLKHLLVAQINMPEKFQALVHAEMEAQAKGGKGEITLKLNNLQDKKMIDLLYEAADKGVKVKLLVRGICCLMPRKNISLLRIVDRYLEHARVYIFHNGGDEKVYLGSADWMERNLYRRIEVVFPILDKGISTFLLNHIDLQLRDNAKAVSINEQLENVRVSSGEKEVHSQKDFYNQLAKGN